MSIPESRSLQYSSLSCDEANAIIHWQRNIDQTITCMPTSQTDGARVIGASEFPPTAPKDLSKASIENCAHATPEAIEAEKVAHSDVLSTNRNPRRTTKQLQPVPQLFYIKTYRGMSGDAELSEESWTEDHHRIQFKFR
ncbi:hypothetical protein HBI24_209970 [Parastagonospora nodorum]|nr:hypothetical protein HBH51_231960 [Parastagonospora nodorum]KAH4045096.1 hypothetical protein HBH49_204830 [Parastagonospora nodorum]KAH4062823.1 hypothetical protein HBH50_202670 [Parastagonospora nodorum]KAH4081582.1 hypothetical protein HBH48_198310 [Parastagonospora nodorum]KAH4084444.1 hypothetical protein HBH46_213070 [Parastagonospora nodorum]